MDKLEQLEKALKEYREMLEKNMEAAQTGMPAGTAGGGNAVNTTMPAGVEKNEETELPVPDDISIDPLLERPSPVTI